MSNFIGKIHFLLPIRLEFPEYSYQIPYPEASFVNIDTNAIIPVSSRGAKKIPSLCSEQAVRSHTVNVIARSVTTRQSQPFFMRLPRPFRARNDIVKIYIAFILVVNENPNTRF